MGSRRFIFHDFRAPEKFIELEKKFSRPRVFGRVLAMVQAAGCTTVVEERNPLAIECRAENEVLTRNFQARYEPTRFHFFEGTIPNSE